MVTTLAGSGFGYADGSGTDARFNTLQGVTVDAIGNVYVADAVNHRIRKLTAGGGTLIGSVILIARSRCGQSCRSTVVRGLGVVAPMLSLRFSPFMFVPHVHSLFAALICSTE